MNERARVAEWLGRLVMDGLLTEDAAAELLRRYDAGEMPDGWELPLPPSAGVTRIDEGHVAEIVGGLLGLLFGLARSRTGRLVRPTITRYTPHTAQATTIQQAFEAQARQLAGQLAQGTLTPAAWQARMGVTIATHLAQQTMAGYGTPTLSAAQWQRLNGVMLEQAAYLSRYADQMVLRLAQGQPLSEAYLANRSLAYGGVGRGLFFQAQEQALIDGDELGYGWVIDYVSRDDAATCSNCLDAQRQGPYLPGQPHPLPGQVCLGRSRCRCRVEYRYDVRAYLALGGI